jgi:hypothetical protein
MSKYKLLYFDGKGRGEPIRLLFHIIGVEFEDVRLSDEEWETVKQSKCVCFLMYCN